MKVYVIIRNSEDQGLNTPEVFMNYDLARKRFGEILKEEWDYISDGDDDVRDDVYIEEEDKDTFVYVDEDGRHESIFYECETQDKEQEVK